MINFVNSIWFGLEPKYQRLVYFVYCSTENQTDLELDFDYIFFIFIILVSPLFVDMINYFLYILFLPELVIF